MAAARRSVAVAAVAVLGVAAHPEFFGLTAAEVCAWRLRKEYTGIGVYGAAH